MGMLSQLLRKKSESPSWKWSPGDLPWYEQPDAAERLHKMRAHGLTEQQYDMLAKWLQDGYCVLQQVIPHHQIDAMNADMEALWTAEAPREGLAVVDLKMKPDESPAQVSHEELLKLPLNERMRVRKQSIWRIHGFHWHSDNARRIFDDKALNDTASLIFDRPAEPTFTINFMYGSRQSLHQDSCVFHIAPPNYLMGAWLACEDITADSGPLVYYPGSHREPMFPGFHDYPQTNLRTMPKDKMPEYYEYVNRLSEKYERKQFLARKGDVLLWHGMLIHGGDEVTNSARTRKSYVCHYIPPGMNKSDQVKGPFNW
jgi:ectoine hydroxylase-related dioxygenase (phytanoyl-CoA dioxygenase family)